MPSLIVCCGVAYTSPTDDKTSKVAAVASDGQFWIAKVLATVEELEKDTKHVTPLAEVDEDERALRQKAREVIQRLGKVRTGNRIYACVPLISACPADNGRAAGRGEGRRAAARRHAPAPVLCR